MSLADLAWAVEDVRARLKPYALARAYDCGDHRLVFATQKYRNTFGDLFREFADNMCDDVVDALTDRLQTNGWSSTTADAGADGKPAADGTPVEPVVDPLTKAASDFWERTSAESRIGAVRRNAIREGDGFVIVQKDAAGAAQPWKQRPEQMAVRYSTESPDQIDVAAKVWKAGKRYRATLYYPDGSVERYATKGLAAGGELPKARSFTPLEAGDPDLVALNLDTYVDPDGDGMPVFHYPNGEVSEYGNSVVLKLIPLQDALNKAVSDMLVAMEFHAYPQRWAAGIQVEVNSDGTEKSPFQAGEGRVWRTGSKDATFGQFPAAEMDGFLKVQDTFRLEIARKGNLPPHAVNLAIAGGTPPTGISLLVTEGRVIKWAKDRQRDWGQTDRRLVAYSLGLEGNTVDPADLVENWAPAETRDTKALLEELDLKLGLGVPKRQLQLEMGYSPDQVAAWALETEQQGETADLARAVLAGGRRAVTQGDALGLAQGVQPAANGDTAAA